MGRGVQGELELKMEKALRETRPEKWDKVKGYTKRAQVATLLDFFFSRFLCGDGLESGDTDVA